MLFTLLFADQYQGHYEPSKNNAEILHCVQKKTPTQIFFHISMNYLWI